MCDITLHDLEKQILQQADHILTWWRYRDDILVIYESTLDNFKNLIHTMNQMHPTLKFTFEASDTSINYLDLTIFKGKRFRETGILDTKVYTKLTETYQYLHKTSSPPPPPTHACSKHSYTEKSSAMPETQTMKMIFWSN